MAYRPRPKTAGVLSARAVQARAQKDRERANAGTAPGKAEGVVPQDLATNKQFYRTKARKQAAMYLLKSAKRTKPKVSFRGGTGGDS